MGIHYWSKSAVLAVSVLFSIPAISATSVPTPSVPFANIMNAAQGAVGLPYGDAAFFGPEFTAEHTAGSRFTAGPINGQAGSVPSKVKVAIKPVVTINPLKLAKSAVSSIKGANVPAVIGSAAVMWAIDQIPGASVVDDVPHIEVVGEPMAVGNVLGAYYWEVQASPYSRSFGPQEACDAYLATKSGYYVVKSMTASGDQLWYCRWGSPTTTNTDITTKIALKGTTCPPGGSFNPQSGYCLGTSVQPFSEADYADLEAAIASVTNSDWLRDLTKAKCEGSLAPEACYQDLVTRRPNHGPSSQLGPKASSTSTTVNPDGTTSSTTTTTQHKYDYSYTETNFTYKTTTTTTVTKDGQTTTTTTEDTTDPTVEPDQEPTDENEDLDINFEDSEFPSVTPFYEQKYPDGLSGVWSQVSSDIDNSAFIGFLKSFVPTFSGTCPTFDLSFNIASWANYGAISFWNMCWIFDFIKVIFLVTAVFTARALTFGG